MNRWFLEHLPREYEPIFRADSDPNCYVYVVYSFSSDPEGEWKNYQRVLKFLPLIFGSETSE